MVKLSIRAPRSLMSCKKWLYAITAGIAVKSPAAVVYQALPEIEDMQCLAITPEVDMLLAAVIHFFAGGYSAMDLPYPIDPVVTVYLSPLLFLGGLGLTLYGFYIRNRV